MLYSDADIEKIRISTDIQSVVNSSVCPICGKQSIIVDGKRQFYYCEDCESGGNVFTYIIQIKGKTFSEAVEELSEKEKIELTVIENKPIDWDKLIGNGKQYGIEHCFYDDTKLRKCLCGGKPKMYSKENKNKKHSFEHISITCEKCCKSVHGTYDISGNPSETYPEKEIVIQTITEKWNDKNDKKKTLIDKVRKGIYPSYEPKNKYEWNMPGIPNKN